MGQTDQSANVRSVRKVVTVGNYALTTIESPLLLTAELDTTDSDLFFNSTRGAEGAGDVPNDDSDDDPSKACTWPDSGSGGSCSSAVDPASCVTSFRGDIDKKDAELASDCASEDRMSSMLASRDSALGDC